MSEAHSFQNDFLDKISKIIEENISNEQFGVSELALEIGMSRSNLLRKVKKITNLSVSQYIRQIRLQNAMELLKDDSFTVSEVSYKVGFSSPSYFIKCFRDFYGYPPGEAGKRENKGLKTEENHNIKRKNILLTTLVTGIILVAGYFAILRPFLIKRQQLKESIAVLPFRNDSNDSTNVYIINGLMESILSNLQKIENLNVISRTSVEKYRNTDKSIKEIGRELNVSYIVEGSGQKIGDNILLNIQLINAAYDKHLWAEQYRKETKDIFQLQMDVARNIADEIQVIITPEEEIQINKVPTTDLVAYDYFLKGLDLFHKGSTDNLLESVQYYQKAIEQDNNFARAYAGIAINYYFLDAFLAQKKYIEDINKYADKALLIDPQLEQGLIAKALSYMINDELQQAIPYLEKALNINPNSATVLNMLSDIYARYIPNTQKYLEYALKGVQLNIASYDSTTTCYVYLHISNALIQSGFVKEAETYINKSLEFDPRNIYSNYVKAYILLAKNKNYKQAQKLLLETFEMDTTRLDVLQEVGKIYYYMRDFENSYKYFKKFVETKKAFNLDIFPSENGKIGVVYDKVGLKKESDELLEAYKEYAQNDQSIYKNLSLAMYYAYKGNEDEAIEHLRLFSREDNYFYWIVLFLKDDPLIDKLKDNPEFNNILDDIETKFWEYHNEMKISLEKKGLV